MTTFIFPFYDQHESQLHIIKIRSPLRTLYPQYREIVQKPSRE